MTLKVGSFDILTSNAMIKIILTYFTGGNVGHAPIQEMPYISKVV